MVDDSLSVDPESDAKRWDSGPPYSSRQAETHPAAQIVDDRKSIKRIKPFVKFNMRQCVANSAAYSLAIVAKPIKTAMIVAVARLRGFRHRKIAHLCRLLLASTTEFVSKAPYGLCGLRGPSEVCHNSWFSLPEDISLIVWYKRHTSQAY
jgi:hypothetical protein